MGILNIAALAGALFLAVPILIHLIHRQRYPRVRFSTLRFFDKTRKHNVIQRRLIDLILLALRVAALVALVLGLARPIVGTGENARTSAVIVLDNSPSMSAIVEGKTSAFDLARAKSLELLGALRKEDQACVVLTVPLPDVRYTADKPALRARVNELAGCELVLRTKSGKGSVMQPTADAAMLLKAIDKLPANEEAAVVASRTQPPRLTQDLAAVRRQVEDAHVAWQPGSIGAAITQAAGIVYKADDAQPHLFVFSDVGGNILDEAPSLREYLAGQRAQLHLVNLANQSAKNVAIENVTLSHDEVFPGEPVKVTVLLRNCSKQPSGPVAVSVEMPGEKPVVVREAAIAGGKSRSVDVTVSTFARESFTSGVARIECVGDCYAADDACYFTIPVRPTARVLCVNGVPSPQPADRETFYLASALAPKASGTGDQAVSGIDVRTRDADGLADEILFQYDVTVLANVKSLDEKMRKKIAAYLRDGRSVLVFLGDQCEPADCNAWGFLPGTLGEKKQGEFVVLAEVDYEHPFLRPFADPAYGDLRAFGAYGYVALDIARDPAARVLAKFQNGWPAIVEKKIGEGRVIVCTTSAHTAWSKWPLEPAFVPFVQQMARYLASPRQRQDAVAMSARRGYVAGESLLAGVEESFRAGTAVAYRRQLDDGRERLVPVAMERRADGGSVRIAETDAPGNYLLAENPAGQAPEIGTVGIGARQFGFSVNVDRSESNLASPPADKLAKLFRDGQADAVELPLPEGWSPAAQLTRGGSELWWYLLVLMAGLVTAESLVAWRTVSKT